MSLERRKVFGVLGLLAAVTVITMLQRWHRGPPTNRASVTSMAGETYPSSDSFIERSLVPTSRSHGVQGRVLDRRAKPVSASVWLVPNSGRELATRGAAPKRPIAVAQTDEAGRYRLGVEAAKGWACFDVWILAESMVDKRIADVALTEGEWRDLGTVRLADGATIVGIVSDGNANTPIKGATITIVMQPEESDFVFLPGREGGLSAITDDNGRYRITKAPLSTVRMEVTASGFIRLSCKVKPMPRAETVQDCKLWRGGTEISGHVQDSSGKSVVAAEVIAIQQDADRTQVRSRTLWDGRFRLAGLPAGLYALVLRHDNYVEKELPWVNGGTKDMSVNLQRLGSASVYVSDSAGRMCTDYGVTVRRLIDGQADFGLTDAPRTHIRCKPGEPGVIEGLAPGVNHVLQIEAAGYAHAFSEPFVVALDTDPVPVFMHLDEGGNVEGTIINKNGQPVSGARVATAAFDTPDHPSAALRAIKRPTNATRTSTVTDDSGRFRLACLYPGSYVLSITHREYCLEVVKNVQVRCGDTYNLMSIRMRQGTIVSGCVRMSGTAAKFMKVVVASPSGDNDAIEREWYGEAVTATDGSFTVQRRFPRGEYDVRVSRSLADPQSKGDGDALANVRITIDGSSERQVVDIEVPTK